ncbi:GNAT family N-acetyltransferase [Streptomyces iconiensis]|uniref:GNAT family N-acetyltransferase n=1 Tax=Streptomyces iconiensis TaxID=1384038 RepID=A0ABT6ZMV2_9ACTN|nr:GNAT family N-acetyltransferase [Streptomyces iconiensis]MDJ1130380.1 GNAT family N-acetyltransferase [Streptomyces iconiensis]
MPTLIAPTIEVRSSFLAAMREFEAETGGADNDNSMVGEEMREYAAAWETEDGFRAYLARLREAEDERTPWQDGSVGCTTLWWVEDTEYVGRIAIRHELSPGLLEVGGHIGYDVRPSARRRGHATALLRAAFPHIRALGIDKALITCDTGNVASRKVIEACGGVLEDERHGKLRYWVDPS